VVKIILVIGIDVSKDEFHVLAKEKTPNGNIKIKGSRSFTNDGKGFSEFALWVSKRRKEDSEVSYVMEATGTYYEDLAYYLYETGDKVCVVLANKIKHFSKSLNVKTKTDKVDASIIAEIGIQRELMAWKPMSVNYKQLRDLCREMLSLKKEKSRAMCQLHAMNYSHEKTESVLQIKNAQIEFYEQSICLIETEIKQIVNKDMELKPWVENIMKVKGLGLITIIVVLCETNGFETFNNIRQVVSYAGLDVVMKESGTFKGKTKISKKGNARIRQCLFMPALTATIFNDKIKDLYDRINEKNPGIKRKGIVAGMRKLLILIFVLWKKNEKYNSKHQWQSTDIGR
jgi:transposase